MERGSGEDSNDLPFVSGPFLLSRFLLVSVQEEPIESATTPAEMLGQERVQRSVVVQSLDRKVDG